jgi:hypothetical protein
VLEPDICELPVKVAVAGDHHLPPSLAPWMLLFLLFLTRPFVSSRDAGRRRRDAQPSVSVAVERRRKVSALAATTSTGSPIPSSF